MQPLPGLKRAIKMGRCLSRNASQPVPVRWEHSRMIHRQEAYCLNQVVFSSLCKWSHWNLVCLVCLELYYRRTWEGGLSSCELCLCCWQSAGTPWAFSWCLSRAQLNPLPARLAEVGQLFVFVGWVPGVGW